MLKKSILGLFFFLLFAGINGQTKRIYIANDDHTDYMWSGTEDQYRQAFIDMLDYYLNLAESTSGLSSEFQSRFNCDGVFWVRTYELNKTAQQFQRLINNIKDGHIGVPANMLISTYGGQSFEAIIRGMYYSGSLERKYGISFPVAMAMENQTLPYGLPTIFAGSGVKYCWHGVCACASDVQVSSPRTPQIYKWTGADGNSVLMKWYSLGSSNKSLGGYAEAYDPADAVNQVNNILGTTSYPYNIGGAFGYGWDRLETTTNIFVSTAQNTSNSTHKVIVSNEHDFFQDFESTYSNIPSLACSFGNDWDIFCASLAEVSARVKRAVEKLRAAEAMSTLVSLRNSSAFTDLIDLRTNAWISLGLYWEHDFAGSPDIDANTRAAWERKMEKNITTYVDSLYNRSSRLLGTQIIKTGSNRRFYVFNPLSWQRTDVADFKYSGSENIYIVDKTTGNQVPSQFITKNSVKYLRILASDVPSEGYKTFEIVSGSPTSKPDAATVSGNNFENSYYKLQFTNQGVITSLIDKTNGNREYAKAVNSKYINDLGSGTGNSGTMSVLSSGPVSVTLSLTSDLPKKHTTLLTLYKDINRIDIENQITQNFSGELKWAYSFNLSSPEVMHEEIGAIIKAKLISQGGAYANNHAAYKWLTLNHFAAMNQGTTGITLSNADCYFMQLGNSSITSLDTQTPQINVLAGWTDDSQTYLIHNQNGDNSFTQRFALQTYAAYSDGNSMRFSLEDQNPFVTGEISGSSGYAEDQFSLLSIDDPNVVAWDVKPSEDGVSDGIILRLYNLNNSAANTNLSVNGTLLTAKKTTHLETETGDATISNNKLQVSLVHNQIQTYKINMSLGSVCTTPGKAAKPSGNVNLCFNSVNTSYSTQGADLASSYKWKLNPAGAGTVAGTGTSATINWNNTYSGKAGLVVNGTNVCGDGPASDTLQIMVYPQLTVDAGSDKTIQYNTSAQLQASASGGSATYSYLWSPANLLKSSNVSNPATNNLTSSAQFTVTVTDGTTQCKSTDNVNVFVTGTPLSVSVVSAKDTICEGETVQITALPTGGAGNYLYSWSSVPAGFTSTENAISVNPVSTIIYKVKVTDQKDSVTSGKQIVVNPLPDKPSVTFMNNQLVSSAITGNQWYNLTGAIQGENKQTYTPAGDGDYFVTVSAKGCSVSSDVFHLQLSLQNPVKTVQKALTVSPNPAKDNLFVSWNNPGSDNTTIYLINSEGKIMFSRRVKVYKEFSQQISVSDLAPGLYLLKVVSVNLTKAEKILIERN